MRSKIKLMSLVGLSFLSPFILSACGTATPTAAPTAAPTTAPSGNTPVPTVSETGKIAILLPETKTARYESQDLPNFKDRLQQLGYNLNDLIYSNANQDASAQQQQAEAAITNGASVLVLDPVDGAAAAAIADFAHSKNVPVISYDRLILNTANVDYYISFDNVQVGKLQATSLMGALQGMANPTIVMINGSPTDNNATLFKQGAHSVFDPAVTAGNLVIAKEYDTPDWSPDQAQTEMAQALTALNNKVDGVYCANDGTASGAIAAMTAAGVSPWPPVTGQDAELAAIQRILVGQQYMTVYKAIKPEAYAAAELAYDLWSQTPVPASMTGGNTVNNSVIDVPSIILTPVAVTKDNIESTVVADGFWTAQDICTADYASACTAAGVK
jgi:D-xylose transport system substrate-binding protein